MSKNLARREVQKFDFSARSLGELLDRKLLDRKLLDLYWIAALAGRGACVQVQVQVQEHIR